MDNKFAHLLQPIRDLAENWDVNVAKDLEDYLVRVCTCILPHSKSRNWIIQHSKTEFSGSMK